MRIALAVVLIVASQLSAQQQVGAESLPAGPQNRDDVVIRVGDREIRKSDVYLDVDLATPWLIEEVVRQRVFDIVVRDESRAHGITVSSKVLDEAFNLAIDQQRAQFAKTRGGVMTLEEYFDGRHGIDAAQHRALVRQRVLSNLLLDRVVRFDQLGIRREECQLILVEERELADELRAKIDKGASFAVLATRHSVHPSATAGGLFPPLPTDVDVPLFKGRETLSSGAVVGPSPITIDGRSFWRILRLVERYEPRTATWGEVSREIEAGLQRKPLSADELTIFEERMVDRYRIQLAAR